MPFGPADPDNPTPSWPVYKAFASGDCARLDAELIGNDMGDFGRVLSAVCAAAVDGEQDQWTVAAAHADADPSALANSCLEPVLDDMVDRALDWHARHPTEVPEVRFVRLPTTTPCAATTGPHSLDGADDARGGGDGATEPVDAVTAPPPPIDEPSADEPSADAPSADAPSEETGVSAVSGPTPPAA